MNRHTDNTSIHSKSFLRRRGIDHIGGINKARVFDAYCGSGQMYQACYHGAQSYFGVDKKNPHKYAPTMKISVEAAIKLCDLTDYNVFDFDAWSSPWHVVLNILPKIKHKSIVIVTDGSTTGIGPSVPLIYRDIIKCPYRDLPTFRQAHSSIQDYFKARCFDLNERLSHIDSISIPKPAGHAIYYHALYIG